MTIKPSTRILHAIDRRVRILGASVAYDEVPRIRLDERPNGNILFSCVGRKRSAYGILHRPLADGKRCFAYIRDRGCVREGRGWTWIDSEREFTPRLAGLAFWVATGLFLDTQGN